jgi:hypothetical protein
MCASASPPKVKGIKSEWRFFAGSSTKIFKCLYFMADEDFILFHKSRVRVQQLKFSKKKRNSKELLFL